ncbi:MAG: hypothetical protein IH899_03235 [Planctomycetes bacterium]|nr:hypothetical protein [Planctomycetota bacterium]
MAAAATVVLEDDPYRRPKTDDVRPVVTPLGSLPVECRMMWMIGSLFPHKSSSTLVRSSHEQCGDHHASNCCCGV